MTSNGSGKPVTSAPYACDGSGGGGKASALLTGGKGRQSYEGFEGAGRARMGETTERRRRKKVSGDMVKVQS